MALTVTRVLCGEPLLHIQDSAFPRGLMPKYGKLGFYALRFGGFWPKGRQEVFSTKLTMDAEARLKKIENGIAQLQGDVAYIRSMLFAVVNKLSPENVKTIDSMAEQAAESAEKMFREK